MKIGYARVSTVDQNLDLQIDALKDAGCEKIFTDKGVGGASKQREGLSQALESVFEGQGEHTLVVWKLDRLGRSLKDLIDLLEEIKESGAGFHSISENIDTETSFGKMFFFVIGGLSEVERDMLIERTKAGMEAAKKRGKHVGRPKALSDEQVAHAREVIESGKETISGMASILGVNRGTLRTALKN